MAKTCIILLLYFLATSAICQTASLRDIENVFLSLPDSFFTQPGLRDFSKIDSFPLSERKWLLDSSLIDGVTSKSSHYSRLLINNSNKIIVLDNGSGTTTLKLWNVSRTEKLLCILTTISDFVKPSQKLNFYWIENGKYKPAKDLISGCLALIKFFNEKDLIKNKIGKKETICNLHYGLSFDKNLLEISPDHSQFEADYAADERLVKLSGKMIRETISFRWEKNKFKIAGQKK